MKLSTHLLMAQSHNDKELFYFIFFVLCEKTLLIPVPKVIIRNRILKRIQFMKSVCKMAAVCGAVLKKDSCRKFLISGLQSLFLICF